jgi:hypothetical protein
MRLIPAIPAALILLVIPATAFSQDGSAQGAGANDWARFVSPEDGFSANYPGQPKMDAVTYTTEYRVPLPAHVYNAADGLGRYSTTVVDYRGSEKLHNERAAACRAATGVNLQDGDACQNNFRADVAGAIEFALWNFMSRDGVKITQYTSYSIEMVSGRLLQMTNRDRSRTYASLHQHAGRLYIHEATVPPGMPEPILFMQSLAWANEKGLAIRYRTLYTEGYGEWRFPAPLPPHTLRDLNTSIDGTVIRK